MSDQKIPINLRAVRAQAGLSLSKTAELTGVSKAMLGQIERGESCPTIATLWKLAKGFHMPLSAFVEDLVPPSQQVTPPQRAVVRCRGDLTIWTLFPFDPNIGSESFLVTLEAGQSHLSNAHDAGVVEDVFVTCGAIELLQAGEWIALNAGDCLRFAADKSHGYRNLSSVAAQFYNTIHYPKASHPVISVE